MDYADWNRGLLLSELLIVIAGMSLVSARTTRDAILAVGVLVQGIVMTFAAGGAYFPRAELAVATTALMAVFGLWCLWMNTSGRDPGERADPLNAVVAEEMTGAAGADDVSQGPGDSNGAQ